MGLDQYASFIDEKLTQSVDFEPDNASELYYWRKHPDLHGWMRELYFSKGGANPDFNCATVEVTKADLDRLEADVLAKQLPKTEGFFFGESVPENANDDLDFISKARRVIAEGYTVFYDSWW